MTHSSPHRNLSVSDEEDTAIKLSFMNGAKHRPHMGPGSLTRGSKVIEQQTMDGSICASSSGPQFPLKRSMSCYSSVTASLKRSRHTQDFFSLIIVDPCAQQNHTLAAHKLPSVAWQHTLSVDIIGIVHSLYSQTLLYVVS